MYTENQTTILNEISFFGKPENMEKVVNVKILPAEADTGIIFKRVDFKENNSIKVDYNNVYVENRCALMRFQLIYDGGLVRSPQVQKPCSLAGDFGQLGYCVF